MLMHETYMYIHSHQESLIRTRDFGLWSVYGFEALDGFSRTDQLLIKYCAHLQRMVALHHMIGRPRTVSWVEPFYKPRKTDQVVN